MIKLSRPPPSERRSLHEGDARALLCSLAGESHFGAPQLHRRRRRIAARRDGVSEATAAVLEAQVARVEPLAAAERAWVIEDSGSAGN